MTKEQLQKHQKWLRLKYGIDGEDIFQQAYMIVLKRYGNVEKVNQNLFGNICREADREIQKHKRYEIPFSYLVTENQDQTNEMEYDPEDPTWRKDFDAIESREEIEKTYGNWLLDALLKVAEKPPKNMVTTDRAVYRKQIKLFEFV
jgi:hypothetical protein